MLRVSAAAESARSVDVVGHHEEEFEASLQVAVDVGELPKVCGKGEGAVMRLRRCWSQDPT